MSDIQLAILRALARREPIDLPELLCELRKENEGISLVDLLHELGQLISALRVLPLSIESVPTYTMTEEIPDA